MIKLPELKSCSEPEEVLRRMEKWICNRATKGLDCHLLLECCAYLKALVKLKEKSHAECYEREIKAKL